MNSVKGAHELQKKVRETSKEAWNDKAPDSQLLIHDATVAQLWSPENPSRSKF